MAYNIDFERPLDIDEYGMKLIEFAKKAIALPKESKDRDSIIDDAMNKLYNHFAKYDEKRLNVFELQLELFKVEQLLKREYLPINTIPLYSDNQNNNNVLQRIINYTRKQLAKDHNLETDSLEKECPNASYNLENLCARLGIETIHFGINQQLSAGMFHHFTIIRIKQENGEYKNYLADCTYRQFFTKKDSNPRRIGVMRGPAAGCSIGSYMMLSENRKRIAETILSQGYIELTPEVFKEYIDAIIYSGRDKDFYEKKGLDYLNPNDVSPTYSIDDYLQIMLRNRVINKREYSILRDKLVNEVNENNKHNRR